ncbi:MAG: polyprenol monophosphomannose synthase [Candidatus Omnitrophica bacterium]|nr:polyprenol monophosphomannose synthase [Candidatus Omnitrophota bacterium]MDD5671163.1 polyprenol monophosphomannose synthase [Candidatus Omnitrophota bacterium]
MKTIIVIPTYNEHDNIRELIPCIRKETQGLALDMLVVDSASPDRTADAVREIQKEDRGVFLLEQPKKLGLGKAYLDGVDWVLQHSYDCMIMMDADFSHHPKYLREIVKGLETHDLVIGSRYIPCGGLQDWPVHRIGLSRFANWYARTLTGLPFSDLTAGFAGYRTDLLRRIVRYRIHAEGYAFTIEMKHLAILQGARALEIPIVFTDRTKGDSKISKRVILESVFFCLKRFFQRKRIRAALAKIQSNQSDGRENAVCEKTAR